MLTLEEFFSVFVAFLPLYFAMVLVPSMISSLVQTYIASSGLVRVSRTGAIAGLVAELEGGGKPLMGRASDIAIAVIVAPFAEELIFRGIPLLIHPALAWIGTIGWALAHSSIVAAEVQAASINPSRAVLAGASHALYFISSGVFYMLIWSLGFAYGAVAIAYHVIHNLLSVIVDLRLLRPRERKAERPFRPVSPVTPIPIIGRRVQTQQSSRRALRDALTGSSLYLPPPDTLVKKFKPEEE